MGQTNTKQTHFTESVTKLTQEDIKFTDKEFWDGLIEDCQEELLVYELRFEFLKQIIYTHPENLVSLVYYITNKIQSFVNKSAKILLNQDELNNLSACIRILIKIIPPIFSHDNRKFSEVLFWTNGCLEAENIILHIRSDEDAAGVEIQKLSDILGSEFEDKSKSTNNFLLEGNEGSCVAEVLVSLMNQLLFLPNYTISSGNFDPSIDNFDLIWTKGVGTSKVQYATPQIIANRKLVLTLLLACFSQQLYFNTEKLESNGWLEAMVRPDNTRSKILLFSLLNTSLNYDPIGWGLPYNYLLFADNEEELVDLSLQTLSVLLHYSATSHDNVFVEHLKSISDVSELSFIYRGLSSLINNPIYSKSSYLPASTKEIGCYQEQLILFWALINFNREFMNYILRNEDITSITSTILYYMVEDRNEDKAVGFIHLVAFTLLVLSGERLFGIQLNKPCASPNLPRSIPPFKGNYNDFLILVFHKMFNDANIKLTSLHECLMTIIANLSPYIASLSMVSSMALLKLFKRFSTPQILLSHEKYPRYIHFLLETFNNLIQYQFPGNHPLVYAILIHKENFSTLSSLRIKPNPNYTPVNNANQSNNPDSNIIIEQNNNNQNNNINNSNINNIIDNPDDRWVPTNEWLQDWKSQLPLSTPIRLIKSIEPELPMLLKDASDENAILNYLKTTTLVGLLPVPHPILIRKYQQNEATSVWFLRFIWGLIVVRSRNPAIFGSKSIKFFKVL